MTIPYSSVQDAKDFDVARPRRGTCRHCISTPQPRTPVEVFLCLPDPVVRGPLELRQLPAPVGPLQLYAPSPRLPIVWIACADRPTAVGGLAVVACSFDRGCVGSGGKLRVRHSAIPRADSRAWLPRRHDSELAWRHRRLRARVHDGPPSRIPSYARAVCADGGHVSHLDQGQLNLERSDADPSDRGYQRMAGSRSLADAGSY